MDTNLIKNGHAGGCSETGKPDQPDIRKTVTVPAYFAQREIFARLLGGILLVLFAPLTLLCMLVVRVTSPGPALFRQKRLGKDGTVFEVMKIRTMYSDAEKLSGPQLCQQKDPRITPVGRVLRFLHLDELPQLVNVAKREMCLVGPRPERPEIIEQNGLNELVPGFSERIKVLPGVTGLAQINLPADLKPECAIPKVKLDLEYIETASLGLDLRILLCTACRMMGIRHGYAVKLFGLCRKVSLGQELPKKKIVRTPKFKQIWTAGQAVEKAPAKEPSLAVASVSANGPTDVERYSADNENCLGSGDSELDSSMPNRPR